MTSTLIQRNGKYLLRTSLHLYFGDPLVTSTAGPAELPASVVPRRSSSSTSNQLPHHLPLAAPQLPRPSSMARRRQSSPASGRRRDSCGALVARPPWASPGRAEPRHGCALASWYSPTAPPPPASSPTTGSASYSTFSASELQYWGDVATVVLVHSF